MILLLQYEIKTTPLLVFYREGEKGKAGYKSSDAASKQGCGVELGLNCKQSSGDLDKCNLKFRQIQLCKLNKYIHLKI